MKTRTIFLLSVFAIIFNVFSAAGEDKWAVYTTENSGLLDNLVRSISIDLQGSLWFGTDSGIVKFDATNWTVYDKYNAKMIFGDVLSTLSDCDNNIIWFGTRWSGLFKFDGTKWFQYTTSFSRLPNNCVTSIAKEKQGNLWIGTFGGLCDYDGKNWIVYDRSNSGLPTSKIKTIVIDSIGCKWIGTSLGVTKYDGISWTLYNSKNSELPHDIVTSIAIDKQNNKWFGTTEGLVKYDGTNWTLYNTNNSGLHHNSIITIAIDSYDNKWIGTNGSGAAKFDNKNWTVYSTYNSSLPNNCINTIAIDSQNNKWFGTYGGVGVLLAEGTGIKKVTTAPNTHLLITPNPVTTETTINFMLDTPANVSLTITDLSGIEINKLLNKEFKPAGQHSVKFIPNDLAAGVYFCTLTAGNYSETVKIVVK